MGKKNTISLIFIGNFLEYFDLMLYVHMSVLLNDLFFPKENFLSGYLLAATTFSLTFVIRPIAGFVIGHLGDVMGRKFTIVITTFLMALSCILMATLPTYAEIGITASISIIICRMMQGFSSLGEVTSAYLYIYETLKKPYRAITSGIVGVITDLGEAAALIVASLVLSTGLSWRWAFAVGALIAIVGLIARLKLRETPEFVDYKRRMANKSIDISQKIKGQEINFKTIFAFAAIKIYSPIQFYIAFFYLGDFMKSHFHMSAESVINQNLKLITLSIFTTVALIIIVKKFHPIRISIYFTAVFTLFLPLLSFFIENAKNNWQILAIQYYLMFFTNPTFGILDSVSYRYFPISKRFKSVATTFGCANSLGYITGAFAVKPIALYFGHQGLFLIIIPTLCFLWWGVMYFRRLEISRSSYFNYPNEDLVYPDTAINENDYVYKLSKEYSKFTLSCSYSLSLIQKLQQISSYTKLNIKLIKKAMIFAKKWHHGQVRIFDNKPFYSHPFAVAELVAEKSAKTDTIVSALLHDVIEDSECTVQIIKTEFNARIAEIVDRLTKVRSYTAGIKIKLSLKEVLEKLQKYQDEETIFIKKMDRLHNLQTAIGLNIKKRIQIANETHHLTRLAAIICEKLNISEKISIENELFRYSSKLLDDK